MDKIIREPVDGWMIRMNDEVGKRAVPGCCFRFGRDAMSSKFPVVEIYQPGWSVGTQHFMPFKTEDELRAFLLGLGFTEYPRVTDQRTPRWELGQPPEPLTQG